MNESFKMRCKDFMMLAVSTVGLCSFIARLWFAYDNRDDFDFGIELLILSGN